MCPSVSGQNYWRTRYNNRDSGVCLDAEAFPPAMHNVAPERWHLYLPRNLSKCDECRRELEEHVRRKAKLLDDYLHKYHPEMLGSGVFLPIAVESTRKRAVNCSSETGDVTFFLERRDSTASNDSTTISESSLGSEAVESPCCDGERNKISSRSKTLPTLQEEHSNAICNRSCLVKKLPYRSTDSWVLESLLDDEHIRRRKSVRFADSIGLELEHVRFLMRPYQPDANKPITSISRNGSSLIIESAVLSASDGLNIQFVPQFTIPRMQLPFSPERGSVYLEHLVLPGDSTTAICGRVRVENIDFEKKVTVRYTTDAWKTQTERAAQYMFSYGDGRSDAFSFALFLNKTQLVAGARLQFAICCEFPRFRRLHWDNNNGKNYSILITHGSFFPSHSTHDLLHAL